MALDLMLPGDHFFTITPTGFEYRNKSGIAQYLTDQMSHRSRNTQEFFSVPSENPSRNRPNGNLSYRESEKAPSMKKRTLSIVSGAEQHLLSKENLAASRSVTHRSNLTKDNLKSIGSPRNEAESNREADALTRASYLSSKKSVSIHPSQHAISAHQGSREKLPSIHSQKGTLFVTEILSQRSRLTGKASSHASQVSK